MNSDQVVELLETLGQVREAVRELRKELLTVRGRLRRVELGFVFAGGLLLAQFGPSVLRLIS